MLLKSKFHIDITQKDYNLLKTTLSDALYKIRSLGIKIEKFEPTWDKLVYIENRMIEYSSSIEKLESSSEKKFAIQDDKMGKLEKKFDDLEKLCK